MTEEKEFRLYDRKYAVMIPTIKGDNHRVLVVMTDTSHGWWDLDDLEVSIRREAYKVRLSFRVKALKNTSHYWYFHADEQAALIKFFDELGFPTEQPDPMGIAKYE